MSFNEVQSAKQYMFNQLGSIGAMAYRPGVRPTHAMRMNNEFIKEDIAGWRLENVALTTFGRRHVLVGRSGSLFLMGDDDECELTLVCFTTKHYVNVHPLLTLEGVVALVERLEELILEVHFSLEPAQ